MTTSQPRTMAMSPPTTSPFAPYSSPLSKAPRASYQPMSPDAFAQHPNAFSPTHGVGRTSVDKSPPLYQSGSDVDGKSTLLDGQVILLPTILMRRLPASMSREALTSMLLFAEDFVEAHFASPENTEDKGFQTAVARFRTMEGAHEARRRLHGKFNSTTNATMIVEVFQANSEQGTESRRKVSDTQPGRQLSTSASSGASSNGTISRQSSRFNSTFKSMEKISPPSLPQAGSNGEFSSSDSNASLQNFFSPQSPVNNGFNDRPRVSGKSVINDDAGDDETGELLKDPVAYARSGQIGGMQRHPTNPRIPLSRLANLSLSTNGNGNGGQNITASASAFGPGRGMAPLQSPLSELSPTSLTSALGPASPSNGYPMSPQFQRHHYPPANPADQNPPCNTLYVGNLPVDTSEDELKAMFSKQRGYKRLCFRTKHNGPMCFVEFEDVSFATKALNELYGHPLHNSVKGGIRLSFSKNPLGVRAGQANTMGPQANMTSPNTVPGLGGALGAPPGFSSVSGPPPGLAAPPGLSPPMPMNAVTSYFGPTSPPLATNSTPLGARGFMGHGQNGSNNNYADYMMGR